MVQTDVKFGVRYELQQNIYFHGNTEWKNTEYELITVRMIYMVRVSVFMC